MVDDPRCVLMPIGLWGEARYDALGPRISWAQVERDYCFTVRWQQRLRPFSRVREGTVCHTRPPDEWETGVMENPFMAPLLHMEPIVFIGYRDVSDVLSISPFYVTAHRDVSYVVSISPFCVITQRFCHIWSVYLPSSLLCWPQPTAP